MNSGEKVAMRNYFESLPVYSEYFDVAYTSVEILRLKEAEYQKLLQQYPILINLLYISGTAEIQRGRRERLNMLRMNKTPDRIVWVQQHRRELYQIMDRMTLAQYIGVSRASLYRAFEKNKKYQF